MAPTTAAEYSMTAAELAEAFPALDAAGLTVGYRALGEGYMARRVTGVRRTCNCRARSGRSVDSVTGAVIHRDVVEIECDTWQWFTATSVPGSRLALTTAV